MGIGILTRGCAGLRPNKRLLLAGVNVLSVLMECVFVRLPAHTLRADGRLARG